MTLPTTDLSDLGLPSQRDPYADPLPPALPPVVDAAPVLEAAPRPRVAPRPPARAPRPPLRVDVLALVLAAVVCVCVTVLALRGVEIPEVLQTIGYVSAGGAFGLATAGNVGRRP